jgi:hypothetical protein
MKSPLVPLILVLALILAISDQMIAALAVWAAGAVLEVTARVTS